jgi:glyoxylase-like metal-dependent hydrolase (beta-lactamase superfamily II)
LNQSGYKSTHFTIETLDDGVFAAVHNLQSGWAVGNAGIIDLGGETLVFDTTMTPVSGAALLQAAEQLTGNPVTRVVNSHYHNDHTWGNQACGPEAVIIADAGTLELLTTQGKNEVAQFSARAETEHQRFQALFDEAADPRAKAGLNLMRVYYQALAETMPILDVRLPDFTFRGRMAVRGPKNRCELVSFKQGHTGTDTVLFLPDRGIVFMGDLLFVRSHPFLGEAEPSALRAALDEIRGWEAHLHVPGHGPVGNAADLDALEEYVQVCVETSGRLAEDPDGLEKLQALPVPAAYADWALPVFFSSNLVSLHLRGLGAST